MTFLCDNTDNTIIFLATNITAQFDNKLAVIFAFKQPSWVLFL